MYVAVCDVSVWVCKREGRDALESHCGADISQEPLLIFRRDSLSLSLSPFLHLLSPLRERTRLLMTRTGARERKEVVYAGDTTEGMHIPV